MPEQSCIIDTIERIYIAAAEPAEWQPALDAIGALYAGGCTSLIMYDLAARNGSCAMFSGWDPAAIQSYNDHYGARNPRLANLGKWPVGVAAAAESMFDRVSLFKTEFYTDFLRPRDLPDGLGVTLAQDHLRFVRLSVLYPEGTAKDQKRNLEPIQRLTPHLQRAVRLNRQMALADIRIGAVEASLNRLAHGVLIVDAAKQPVFFNETAERILRSGDGLSLTREGVLRAASNEANDRLSSMVRDAGSPTDRNFGNAAPVMTVQRPSSRRPYALLVVPLRLPQTVFSVGGGLVAIFVSDPEDRHQPATDIIARSFGLTAAEARLLAVILAGSRLAEAAQILKVSPHTTKTQLRSIFEKMGCSRQAELVQVAAQHPAWLTRDGA